MKPHFPGYDVDSDLMIDTSAAAALHHAEELNKRIVQSTGDCVKILDLDGRLVYVNPEGLQLLDMTDASELLGRPIAEFFEGEARRQAEGAVERARAGEQGRFQGMFRTASGVAKWWDVIVTPITDTTNTVVQLLAVSRDITERRRDETFHAAQHQLLEMIVTGSELDAVLDFLVRLVEQHSPWRGPEPSARLHSGDRRLVHRAASGFLWNGDVPRHARHRGRCPGRSALG
jgi:PAS domain S-box-containing protein